LRVFVVHTQVELTRWLGAAAVKRDLTDKMRDAQKKEARASSAWACTQLCMRREEACTAPGSHCSLSHQVDDALEAVVSGSAVPTRYLRKDPARNQVAPAAAEGGAAAADGDGSAPSAKVRSYETTATPVLAWLLA
jgi:hypothetical protein